MNRKIKTNEEHTQRTVPDKQLDTSLRKLAARMPNYMHLFDIGVEDLEYLNKQYLAFNWLVTMEEKLKEYLLEVRKLKRELRSAHSAPSFLRFYDLPRPPLFYPDGNIDQRLSTLIHKIKASPHYHESMGSDLGLE